MRIDAGADVSAAPSKRALDDRVGQWTDFVEVRSRPHSGAIVIAPVSAGYPRMSALENL